MTKAERYEFVLQYFLKNVPEPGTELTYKTPFQLLVAVILSAQCTDNRVNQTTPALFNKYPDAASMSKAGQSDIFQLVRSISYPNSKSKHLLETAKIIHNQFHGQVPMEISELVKLPGVGRKTANVVAGEIENKPTMAVDTHVFRVSARLGLTTAARTTLAAEKQLVKYFPSEHINKVNHWLILHGRNICTARKPKCETCPLKEVCKFYVKLKAKNKFEE